MTWLKFYNWAKATDSVTSQTDILYRLFLSDQENLDDPETVYVVGQVVAEGVDADSFLADVEDGIHYATIGAIDRDQNLSLYEQRPVYVNVDELILLVETTNTGTSNNDQFTFPGVGTYTIDWGDGTVEELTGTQTHTYAAAGEYLIKISGALERVNFNDFGDKDKVLENRNWGVIAWTSMENAFYGCSNLDVRAADRPDLSSVTTTAQMFRGCVKLVGNPNMKLWAMGGVTDRTSMFQGCTLFNRLVSFQAYSAMTTAANFANGSGIDQDFGIINLSATLSSLAGFFAGSVTSRKNYNLSLIGWANTVFAAGAPYGVTATGQTDMQYDDTVYDVQGEFTDAVSARAFLVGLTATWTIDGDRDWSDEPVTSGEITFTGTTDTETTANWDEATSPTYTHAQLTYKVYSSSTDNIDSIADAETNGTLETSATGITSYQFTGLDPESPVYVSVVVEDTDGLKGFYSMALEITLPIIDITPSGRVSNISIEELSQSIRVSFDTTNVEEATGYEVQFQNLDGTSTTLHDIGDVTTALIAKSAITSSGQTKTLEILIRPYADLSGQWSEKQFLKTHTEGVKSASIQIEVS